MNQNIQLKDVKIHSLFVDIILTILTFGLFNLWVQIRQIADVNDVLGEDRYSMIKLILLSLITLGLYFCYHEYCLTKELNFIVHGEEKQDIAILCAIGAFLGLWFVVDSYQQSLLNDIVKSKKVIV